jgi:hypothetical protein
MRNPLRVALDVGALVPSEEMEPSFSMDYSKKASPDAPGIP